MKKINSNKGFTLIELLVVIAVLLLITLIAVPNIASSFERNKNRINDQKIEIIKSGGQIYASRYKKRFKEITGNECTNGGICDYYIKFLKGGCGISIQMILDADLITDDELKDSEGNILEYTDSNGITKKIVPSTYASIFVYYDTTGIYKLNNSGSICQVDLS